MSIGKSVRIAVVVAAAVFSLQAARAQDEATDAAPPETAKILKAAADALGMPRNGGEGGGAMPQIDVVNRMQFWGSGTADMGGQESKIDIRESMSYNPPAMRVDITHMGASGAAQHTIHVVREKYAWDESEVGGGLVPGKGTATPAMNADKERLLQLWILPYGVVKAAIAAGADTKVSMENGNTVLTFPLSGELSGVTETATLDSKNLVTKVETKAAGSAVKNLNIEAEYSDYGDHGEVETDVKSPRHITEKQGGKTILDIDIKMWDANNPYEVFPVPDSVKKSS